MFHCSFLCHQPNKALWPWTGKGHLGLDFSLALLGRPTHCKALWPWTDKGHMGLDFYLALLWRHTTQLSLQFQITPVEVIRYINYSKSMIFGDIHNINKASLFCNTNQCVLTIYYYSIYYELTLHLFVVLPFHFPLNDWSSRESR